ncbi:YegP family protein [Nitrosospira sp. Nsp11]|uniref:YegP family protein n=1 Tax=Nitrosospira sp. Nsp11 TaxID=1855338 RepID=UPI000934E2B0
MYFYLFKSDKNSQWYWRLNADNHKTIADGSEGYHNKQDALHGINLVKSLASTSPILDSSLKSWV